MIKQLFQSLTDATAAVDISLEGHPTAYMRTFPAWDTGFRTLPVHLLYYLESGIISLETEGNLTMVGAGSVIILPPGREFRMHVPAGEPIPAFWRLRLSLPCPWPKTSVWPRSSDLQPVMVALVEELPESRPYRQERIRGLLLALFAHLARQAEDTTVDRATAAFNLASRLRLEQHVAQNPQATPRDLARQLDLTLDYFTRRFRETFGIPPRAWLLEQRLQSAAMMLTEGTEDAVVIARRVGFADPRRFSRHFRQRFGHPPGRFRQISGG
jgi:AraC-like DNA-binding protein